MKSEMASDIDGLYYTGNFRLWTGGESDALPAFTGASDDYTVAEDDSHPGGRIHWTRVADDGIMRIVKTVLFLACGMSAAFADDFSDYLDEKPDPQLGRVYSTEYYIIKYRDEYLDHLLAASSAKSQDFYARLKAFAALHALAGKHVPGLTFAKVKDLVEGYEQASSKNPLAVTYLDQVYALMGEIDTPEALDFLKQRASFEFWSGRAMPTFETVEEDGLEPIKSTETAQGDAIVSLGSYLRPEGLAAIHELARDPRYANDAYLYHCLKIALDMREPISKYRTENETIWAKRPDYAAGKSLIPKYIQPNADIVAQPPPFPLVAKIGIPFVAILVIGWLWHEWNKGIR